MQNGEKIILFSAKKTLKYEPLDFILSNRKIKLDDKLIKMKKV